MSLVAWYPLNGNLKNNSYEFGDLEIKGTATSINSSGKTGQCYYSSVYGAGQMVSKKAYLLGDTQSMFCWVKFPSLGNSSNLNGVLGQHRYSYNSNKGANMGITIVYVADSSQTAGYYGLACVNTANASKRTYKDYTGSTKLLVDNWYHIGYTYDGAKIRIYVNGKIDGEYDFTGLTKTEEPLMVFSWSFSSAVPGESAMFSSYSMKGSINDVRVYDHCLSTSEVARLAEGLVLHYDFENPNIESTTNLITSITSGGRTSIINDGTTVLTNGENADTYFYLKLSKTLEAGKTYTLSCTGEGIITNSDGHGDYFRFGLAGQGGVPQISIYNGRSSLTFVATSTQAVNNLLLDDITGHRCLTQCKFYDWQLEEKDHATPYVKGSRTSDVCYDSSGYGHHATVTGSPQIIPSDSPSGTHMIYADGATVLSTDKIFTDNVNQCHTVSFWIKPTETISASTLVNFNSGYRTCHSSSNGKSLCYLNSGTSDSYVYGSKLENGTWYHVTWVVDTDNVVCKVYYNGALNASSGNYTSTDVPAGFASTTKFLEKIKGYIADIKIYATAFSADQVKKLYEVKARSTSSGSLLAGQFVEYGENIAFQSTVDLIKGVQSGYWTAVKKDSYAPNGTGGLGKYTQSNCSVTYEDGECHIYSAPNLTTSENGNTMWGGLCWSPMKIASNVLQDGHRYIITWHMRGKSSSSMDVGWSNYIGWTGTSSNPTPTINGSLYPSTFNDYDVGINCYYDFTINDTVFKEHTATTGNTNFVAGTTYLSYSGFKIGYAYGNTGTNGRDVYISNLQLFDITYLEEQHPGIKSDDVFKLLFMEEKNGNMKIYHGGHVGATEFIEI